MAEIPLVHLDKSPVELIRNMAAGLPGAANGRPTGTLVCGGQAIHGQVIGISISPRPGQANADEGDYASATVYMNPDGGGQMFIPLEKIDFIRFDT